MNSYGTKDGKIGKNKLMQCPCCMNYAVPMIFEFCDVCMWQYDQTSHDTLYSISGANGISLNEARENYKNTGSSKLKYVGTNSIRPPFDSELSENN